MSTRIFNECKIAGVLNAIVFGDVHLGHRRTKTPHTLSGLYHMFDETNLDEVDIIIIEGDLFDRGLELYFDYLPQIQIWMLWLLTLCQEHDIILRVLEGTPSHDMRQSKQFEVVLESSKLDVDFRYVDTLTVERHPKGFDVLYVPDEWTTSHERTYVEAKLALAAEGINKVTFAVMHGNFEHQLPISGLPSFIRKDWEAMVVHAIFIGHIHQYSKVGKTVAAGSFDRHSHGDEATKGHIHAILSDSGCTFTMVPNKQAKIYTTIDVTNKKVDGGLKYIERELKKVPAGSFIRLQYSKLDAYDTALFYLSETHPEYHWSEKVTDNEEREVSEEDHKLLPTQNYVSTSLTRANLVKLMSERLEVMEDRKLVAAAIKRMEELCVA